MEFQRTELQWKLNNKEEDFCVLAIMYILFISRQFLYQALLLWVGIFPNTSMLAMTMHMYDAVIRDLQLLTPHHQRLTRAPNVLPCSRAFLFHCCQPQRNRL